MPPARLPLFPLDVVLFPGTPLPLHIFEPRYRQLLADALAADRRFGLTPRGTRGEAPDPGMVGCTAEIRVNQELPDGRSNLIVIGGSRFTVVRVLDDPAPYHVALVEPFEDEPGSEPDPGDAERLTELYRRYAKLLRALGDAEPDELELPDDPAALSFFVAAGLELDAASKQPVLAERSTRRRVAALLGLLPGLVRAAEEALVIHRRAHGNGRGGAHPSIAG